MFITVANKIHVSVVAMVITVTNKIHVIVVAMVIRVAFPKHLVVPVVCQSTIVRRSNMANPIHGNYSAMLLKEVLLMD